MKKENKIRVLEIINVSQKLAKYVERSDIDNKIVIVSSDEDYYYFTFTFSKLSSDSTKDTLKIWTNDLKNNSYFIDINNVYRIKKNSIIEFVSDDLENEEISDTSQIEIVESLINLLSNDKLNINFFTLVKNIEKEMRFKGTANLRFT
ncbi:hypothetical protein V2E24_01240 [Mycoplasmopsis ciconiae]|uniref:Uncharacterized protein n=1 Tax=Mycoplasmopsis ciconiae TaxID=561067 RepID=A0ABU7MMB8_9BACT|nr:hypothetical protein [Mycoplasmopsis ciconiae]